MNICKRDAVGLAQCVARGEIAARELLDLALAQSAAAQPKTNAVCRLMEDEARANSTSGLPAVCRRSLPDKDGAQVCRNADQLWQPLDHGDVPAEHAHVVRRYLEAGFVIFGKTDLPEFALKACRIRNYSAVPQSLEFRPYARRLQRRRRGRGRLRHRADGGRQ